MPGSGFEPSVTLLPHTLSKRAHSTTLTPALGGRDARNSIHPWQPLFEIFGKSAPRAHPLTRAEDPQQIGQPVEEQPDDLGDRFARLMEGEHKLRSARRATALAKIKGGAGERSFRAWPRPAGEIDALRFKTMGLSDQPIEIVRGERREFLFLIARFVLGETGEAGPSVRSAATGGGQISAIHPTSWAAARASKAEGGVEFIDIAEGFDAQGSFGDALAE